jgi:protein tyrosine kinase modulator
VTPSDSTDSGAGAAGELGLLDYLAMLRTWAAAIVAVTLVVAAAAYLWSASAPRLYSASATVMVSPSSAREGQQPAMTIASFKALVTNRTIAQAVIDQLDLAKPPYGLTVSSFIDSHLALDEVAGTNFLQVHVRLSDPSVAADAANRLAQQAIELATRITARDESRKQDVMKKELDASRNRMDELARQLLDFRQKAAIDLTREDTDSLLDARGKLVPLMVEIEGERARLDAATQQLSQQSPTLTAPRSSDLESALTAADRSNVQKGPGDSPDDVDAINAGSPGTSSPAHEPGWTGLEFGGTYSNPVYSILQYQVAASRARLASLERQQQELADGLKLKTGDLTKLRELYAKESELERRQREYTLASDIYSDMARQYAQERLHLAANTQLSVVDPATPPARPISPRPMATTITAALAGFLLAITAAVIYEVASGQRS